MLSTIHNSVVHQLTIQLSTIHNAFVLHSQCIRPPFTMHLSSVHNAFVLHSQSSCLSFLVQSSTFHNAFLCHLLLHCSLLSSTINYGFFHYQYSICCPPPFTMRSSSIHNVVLYHSLWGPTYWYILHSPPPFTTRFSTIYILCDPPLFPVQQGWEFTLWFFEWIAHFV